MIYFIQCTVTGYVKVGHSYDPMYRAKTLQVGNPFKLELVATIMGNQTYEAQIHKRLEPYHIRGEWFNPCEEMVEYIVNDLHAKGIYSEKSERYIRQQLIDIKTKIEKTLKKNKSKIYWLKEEIKNAI